MSHSQIRPKCTILSQKIKKIWPMCCSPKILGQPSRPQKNLAEGPQSHNTGGGTDYLRTLLILDLLRV